MKVREVMTPAPVTVNAEEPVAAAARAMKENDIGAVPVLTDGKITGMLTDRDITVRVIAAGLDPALIPASDACSPDPVMLDINDDTADAARMMRERALRRMPVADAGDPVGVVSIGDLALTQDERSALADVSAAPPNV